MLKNITFSADKHIIEKARKKAIENNTTLNELFREWLYSYSKNKNSKDFENFINMVSYAKAGRRFTRDELNER